MESLQLQKQEKSQKKLTDLGRHLILDFVGVPLENLDLNNYQQVSGMLLDSLKQAGLESLKDAHKIFEPQGLTMLFVLDHGHLTIHTWPEHQSCAIDFYHFQSVHQNKSNPSSSWDEIKKVEEFICNKLGWQYCTSTVTVPRGKVCRLQTNDKPKNLEMTDILQNVQFIHREKTQYQDLRIYDTINYGRIMSLNGFIVIKSNNLEEKYTVDLCKTVIQPNVDYNDVLILGGGDLVAVNYLFNYFPKVNKISLCDFDEKIALCCKEYFQFGEELKKFENQGKLSIVSKDCLEFIIQLSQQNQLFDAIIIDYSDDWVDDIKASQFKSLQFYQILYSLLKPNCGMSQAVNTNDIQITNQNITSSGFQNISFIDSNDGQIVTQIASAFKI